ncbi:MAG TPA: phosphoribosylanthranilate isomerase [Nitrospirae bacterium]|nr:phosphoribosylanthranilate isomerase [Nitrospirota bacterium]
MRPPVRVKICGITRGEDALAAVESGADALGFVFYSGSPRHIRLEAARDIIRELPPFVTTVGVFVDEVPSTISEIVEAAGIDVVQLHGGEPEEVCRLWPRVIKAFRVRELTDLDAVARYRVSAYLLDTYSPDMPGGTGQVFNWDIALEAKRFGPVVLAGGLTPENVDRAVRWVRPYGVDVSSGVEREKGVKDEEKVRLFIERAKAVFP